LEAKGFEGGGFRRDKTSLTTTVSRMVSRTARDAEAPSQMPKVAKRMAMTALYELDECSMTTSDCGSVGSGCDEEAADETGDEARGAS